MRNFPDFLSAYFEYASDNFCPDEFHFWTGLSILAGALEGKVWIDPFIEPLYPNIYVLLVSHPQVGKSTALRRGMELLEELKRVNQNFKIIPNQTTEASLVEQMKLLSSFQVGSTTVQFSSGFFCASEASSSALKNEHGNFNATITEFYDCPRIFRKQLKSEQYVTEIPNISFNLLAGTTFDFLKNLVNEESVLGGLASRLIYVISRERSIRRPKWGANSKRDEKTKIALVQDLIQINKLIGKFHVTPEFRKLWEDAHPEFDMHLIEIGSSKRESLIARKLTNLSKICMLLSVSQSDDLVLTEDHWHRGLKIMDSVIKENTFVLSSAVMSKPETQSGLNQFILETIKEKGGLIKLADLRKAVNRKNSDVTKFDPTISAISNAGQIELLSLKGIQHVKLLVDPNTNL